MKKPKKPNRPIIARVIGGLLAVVVAAGIGAVAVPQAAHASLAAGRLTSAEALFRAQWWIDTYGVIYSQDQANAKSDGDGHTYRPDCSGFVSMAWHLPKKSNGWDRWTGDLDGFGDTEYLASLEDLLPADAILGQTFGHVALFDRWADAAHSQMWVYEEFSTGDEGRHVIKAKSWYNSNGFRGLRYRKLARESVSGNADVNGDGLSDLVAQNPADVWVRMSNGSSFGVPRQWSAVAFTGQVANKLGDVTGDGTADLIAVDAAETRVMASTGIRFTSPVRWTGLSFNGDVDIHIGDVNGDGRADLIAQNRYDVWVMTSTGSSFNTPARWSSVEFRGGVANHIGDVNGDGRADLIAQNRYDTWVMTSTGSSFNTPARWSAVEFTGRVANHIGDVNHDGRADLVVQNRYDVWVMTSTGWSFNAPARWSTVEFQGNVVNQIADVHGDGYADLIAQNPTDVWVIGAYGVGFGPPFQWASGAFSGRIANHG